VHRDLVVVVAAEHGQPQLPAWAGPVDGLCQRVVAAGINAVDRDDEVAAGEPGSCGGCSGDGFGNEQAGCV
jgi:hypothetical protein